MKWVVQIMVHLLIRVNNKTNKDMFNQKEYNKCAEFEIILGVISMIIMVMIVLM